MSLVLSRSQISVPGLLLDGLTASGMHEDGSSLMVDVRQSQESTSSSDSRGQQRKPRQTPRRAWDPSPTNAPLLQVPEDISSGPYVEVSSSEEQSNEDDVYGEEEEEEEERSADEGHAATGSS
mgnify:FL=1